MKKGLLLILALVLALSAVGCSVNAEEEKVIKLGFVPMQDGDKLIESVKPLEEMLSKELGQPVEAFTATNYVGVVEGLGSGQVDFGLIPPFAYVLANKENDARVILTAINKHGKSFYRSQFIVPVDSTIEDFTDIKGKKLAFVDPSSTSGYLFPGAHLKMEGVDIDNDMEYVYAGGHDKAIQLLLNGDVDVATTFVDARERYQNDFPDVLEKTKVLGYTQNIPNISVTVRGDMDAEMEEKISNALLAVAASEEGGALLKELFNMYGFVESTDSDYQVIRDTAELMEVDLTK